MKAVAICSGGLDSVVMLYKLRETGRDVVVLSFDYGQRARRDLEMMSEMCEKLNIQREYVGISIGSSTNMSSGDSTELWTKVLTPNRNMLYLLLAFDYAKKIGADEVYYGAHHSDVSMFPDCKLSYGRKIQQLMNDTIGFEKIMLRMPFTSMTKAEVIKLGVELKVPFNRTFSCYEAGINHCGECLSCKERIEAFKSAKVADTTYYENGAKV